jgi:hypothetical protein
MSETLLPVSSQARANPTPSWCSNFQSPLPSTFGLNPIERKQSYDLLLLPTSWLATQKITLIVPLQHLSYAHNAMGEIPRSVADYKQAAYSLQVMCGKANLSLSFQG